ncbi:C6 transcription factor [Pleurostoma richardsiae]|uniref:C6 transcription factor n=1 Tax=Pleurostoma richardsiae TaxID=41990 RepID=A0AA38VK83_9PEZI|nr:C6 transcription factor [Pleurostoma richardsiae]
MVSQGHVNLTPSADSDAEGSSGDDEAVTVISSTTAGQDAKRKRSSFSRPSCLLCQSRKVRCDRAEPACSWCTKNNRVCVYRERARPGSKMPSADLEAKVNRIEAMLQVLGRRVEEHIVNHSDGISLAVSPSVAHSQTGLYPGARGVTPAYSTGSGAGQTPTLQGMQVQDRTSVRSLIHTSPPGSQAQQQAITGPVSPPVVGDAALTSDPDLPSSEIIYTLVDLYFKHVNTWCPILDRKATFGAFFGSTMLTEANRVLLHAIVATTLRFYKDPRMTPESKTKHHRVCKQRVEQYALENISLEALKALVILSLDVLGTSNGPLGWNLLSIVVRNVITLDLCAENSVYLSAESTPRTGSLRRVVLPQPESWIEDEGRRRLCWMVYILDRYATVATPFDFMLDDRFLDLALPSRYDLFSNNVPVETRSLNWADYRHTGAPNTTGRPLVNNPENLGSFSYHCEVLRILSRIHNFLRVPLDVTSPRAVQVWRATYRNLDGELNSWLHSLPGEYGSISQLCHSDPASRVANWIMLHAAFVTAVIRLHSSAAYPCIAARSSAQSLFTPSQVAAQRCLSAVKSLRDIAADVLETNGLDLLGPPFAFALWTSARLLLVHAASIDGRILDPVMDFLVDTLRQMGRYWEVAENYARILSDAVAEGRSGQRSFADMRRSATDIVELATRKRISTLEPTSTRLTKSSELDYVDIFDFYNYPKVAVPLANPVMAQPPGFPLGDGRFSSMEKDLEFGFETRLETDWLSFQPPYD